jgi:predicted metalloprotease with PDZ domain
VRIDFDRGKLYFLREPGTKPGLAITLVNGPLGPCIDADLPIGKHGFVIDTGYCGHSGGLRKDAYDLLLTLGQLHPVAEEKAQTVAATTKHACASLDVLSIGSFMHRELVFNREENSYLGLSYLCRFNLTFDFPRSTLYVAKSQHYNSSDPVGLSGLHLLRRNGHDVVMSVDQNSPAEKSCIKAGDILLRLDGKPVSQQRIHSLWTYLRTPNPGLKITIQRNQEELTTTMAVTAKTVAPR